MTIEGADLIYLAEGFAERIAEGDWDAALDWAQSADEVSRGAFLVVERPDGECRAITRAARFCQTPARPGERFCALHARYIRRLEDA
jgi:hypothetical protein